MKQSQLKPYAPLYRAARYYGATHILSQWLGTDDEVLPLLLPHGVEIPAQYEEPADIHGLEPIYWATNRELFARASKIKRSVLIPHPYLLSPAFTAGARMAKKGTLIIGVPPGRGNDHNMLEALRAEGFTSGTVLVKRRVGWEGSQTFWRENGYDTISFGEPFAFTYNDMAEELSRYEHVVSTTASTAAFFASASGAMITLVRGCALKAYELMSITSIMQNEVPEATAWLRQFTRADREGQRELTLKLLGADHMDRDRVSEDLSQAIAALEHPLEWGNSSYPIMLADLQARLAVLVDKPGLASLRPANLLQILARPKVGVMTMRENDYYLDGPSPETFELKPVPYRRGITEPGFPIDPY